MTTNYITDLENHVTTKGYYTSEQLVHMQFEIGERVKAGSFQWDNLYTTLLEDKISEMENGLEIFADARNARVLDEQENLREIGD